jgi:hypothetical protein
METIAITQPCQCVTHTIARSKTCSGRVGCLDPGSDPYSYWRSGLGQMGGGGGEEGGGCDWGALGTWRAWHSKTKRSLEKPETGEARVAAVATLTTFALFKALLQGIFFLAPTA